VDDAKKGVKFNSFEILEILGQGTFGRVFKVRKKDDIMNPDVDPVPEYAMKVLKKAFLVKNNHLKYAIGEANILKAANHPFVLGLHYCFQTPDNLYMVLDYCPGGDLAFHLNKKQMFEENEAKFFIAEVVLAIDYIHSLDVIYRDMKPENILIDGDGHIKLADFGLAKEGIEDKMTAKSFCGSPAYLAPEMLFNKGAGKSADIY
jgi:serine/threonine protein kinase